MKRVIVAALVLAALPSCLPRGLAASLDKLRATCADTHVESAALEVQACNEAYLLECSADDTPEHTLTCEFK